MNGVETFRCPACLFLLTDPAPRRCPSCRKRLGERHPPIVLVDRTKFAAHEPLHIDLVLAERAEHEQQSRPAEPPVTEPRVTSLAAALERQQVGTRPAVHRPSVSPPAPPVRPAPVGGEPDSIHHTTIYQPSQFDPEMRQVLDNLYRKARSQTDDYDEYYDDGP